MLRVLIYYALLLAVLGYAAARGGWAERAAVMIVLGGSILTQAVLSPLAHRFTGIEYSVLAIDILCLAGFTAIALRSDRYWPIWLAALQLIGVLAHLARLADPGMMRTGYAFLLAVWSYPILALIAFGTWSRHREARRTSNS